MFQLLLFVVVCHSCLFLSVECCCLLLFVNLLLLLFAVLLFVCSCVVLLLPFHSLAFCLLVVLSLSSVCCSFFCFFQFLASCLWNLFLFFSFVVTVFRTRTGESMNKLTKLGRCDSYTIEWLNNRTARLLVLLRN